MKKYIKILKELNTYERIILTIALTLVLITVSMLVCYGTS